MITFIPPRLRKPAWTALAGLLFAGAWLIHGGPLWWVSIMAVIATAVSTARIYRLGAQDTDDGARQARAPTSASSWSARGPGPWASTWPRSPRSPA